MPLKIIYTAATSASVDSFLRPHLNTLKKSGHDVMLICTPDNRANSVVKETNVRNRPVSIKADIAPLSDLISLIRLSCIFLSEQPDAVHAHMSKASFLTMISAWVCRVPTRIYHNHGMALFSSTGLKKSILKLSEKISCALATEVIFCGESTRLEAVHQNICKFDKTTILGNGTISGVNLTRFNPTMTNAQKGNLKEELGIAEGQFTVGFVGRIVKHKGIDTLIDSWELLPKTTREKTTLVLAGAHGNDQLSERLLKFCEANNNVKYLGRRPNIEEIYQIFDVLVLPSWHEGFPYSVLEAQCMGVPAIVTEVTGNIDAIENGKTGLYVPKNDAEDLANAISRLVNNDNIRHKMSKAARNRIQQHFSQDMAMKYLSEFYRKLSN